MTGPPNDGSRSRFAPFTAVVDIELTSRCNAHCSFCPRDQTPHLGVIDERTFRAALGRAVEYREAVLGHEQAAPGSFDVTGDTIWLSFCGLGEPLLHPRAIEFVARATDAGFRPIVNTNGALLTPSVAEGLLDAGLAMAFINAGEVEEEYEAVYGLPFERTRENIEHFLTLAKGRCVAAMVLVDHRGDRDHIEAMRAYWSALGASGAVPFRLINRGGSLPIDQAETWVAHRSEARRLLEADGDVARCWVPFFYPFIGYDGHYLLCSSDWRREVDLGTVFERSLVDLFEEKAARVRSRSPICHDCSHEPTNALALALATSPGRSPDDATEHDPSPAWLLERFDHYARQVAAMRAQMPDPTAGTTTARRLIPVRS